MMKACNENINMMEKYHKHNGDRYWKYSNSGKVNTQNIIKTRHVMEISTVHAWWKSKNPIHYKVM